MMQSSTFGDVILDFMHYLNLIKRYLLKSSVIKYIVLKVVKENYIY